MDYPIEPPIESLLLELKKRARAELVMTGDAYEELVDELIYEKLEWGELSDDENYISLRENLVARWPEVLEYVESQETKHP